MCVMIQHTLQQIFHWNFGLVVKTKKVHYNLQNSCISQYVRCGMGERKRAEKSWGKLSHCSCFGYDFNCYTLGALLPKTWAVKFWVDIEKGGEFQSTPEKRQNQRLVFVKWLSKVQLAKMVELLFKFQKTFCSFCSRLERMSRQDRHHIWSMDSLSRFKSIWEH